MNNEKSMKNLEEGKIIDYISGIPVPAGAEELNATQVFSKALVEDYGYPKEFIRTRPQWGVKANPSDTSRSVPVDIAVFSSEQHNADNLKIIVECKKPTISPEEDDDSQIKNYLNWSSAQIGVWYNGSERIVYHKRLVGDHYEYLKIPNLPKFGESVHEIGKYRKSQLEVPKNLQHVFKAIRGHLAGNALGTTRDEVIAAQMINLIFCKIYDEKFKSPDDLVDFRATVEDSDEAVLNRIKQLFDKVKAKYSEVFDENEELKLDSKSVKYVVGELQGFSLVNAPRDAVGAAFEVFIGSTLKGDQGQFFTPRNVVKLMVDLVKPASHSKVIDPACGAGGFLIESLRFKWNTIEKIGKEKGWSEQAIQEEKTSVAMTTVMGLDKDEFLVKVAKAYMAIMGDGKGKIFSEDSLDLRENWNNAASDIHLDSYDIVLANPPFGKDIKVKGKEKLKQYRLGYKWSKNKKTEKLHDECNPQVLFVERCLQLAKTSGLVGIILPETYFHAPSTANVRQILLRENNVKFLIDLPHNTFRPFNNAKCIVAIVEKGAQQQEKIDMIVAEEMGHNHQGKPLYRIDSESRTATNEIWDDISIAMDSLSNGQETKYIFSQNAKEVLEKDIWIPRYYWSEYNEEVDLPSSYPAEWLSFEELIENGAVQVFDGHGSPSSVEKGLGEYTYARVKDIVNWEIYRDPTSSITEDVKDRLVGKNPLQVGDVVYVSRGSYRIGDVALVGPNDTEAALTREIHIFRVVEGNSYGLTPEYLLYLLSTPQVKEQTRGRVFLDTTLPTISKRYKSINLPWALQPEKRDELSMLVRKSLKKRWEAIDIMRNSINQSI